MRPVVAEQWLAFTEPLEGGVSCLYADIRGKVTIAYGNLCDTPSEVAALPLVHADGTFATTSEKIGAWQTIHNDPHAAAQGWRYAARLSSLRLTREGMAMLAMRRLEDNDRILIAKLPEWESYPACAQMAMHSWAWACGANAHFPRLFEAVRGRDFQAASVEIHMNEITPEGKRNTGLIPRNVANRILMVNAQRVEAYHLDPDLLNWTSVLGVSEEETQPDLSLPDSRPNPASSPTIHVDPSAILRPEEWAKDPDDID